VSISLQIKSVEDPLVEDLLRYLEGVKLPLFQKRDLLHRASKWLELADKTTYPFPMAKEIKFEIPVESSSKSLPLGSIQTQSDQGSRTVFQPTVEPS